MPVLSIRVPENIAHDLASKAKILHLSKSAYINKAITSFNEEVAQDLLRKQMAKASAKVRNNSMKVNKEFSDIEDDFQD